MSPCSGLASLWGSWNGMTFALQSAHTLKEKKGCAHQPRTGPPPNTHSTLVSVNVVLSFPPLNTVNAPSFFPPIHSFHHEEGSLHSFLLPHVPVSSEVPSAFFDVLELNFGEWYILSSLIYNCHCEHIILLKWPLHQNYYWVVWYFVTK